MYVCVWSPGWSIAGERGAEETGTDRGGGPGAEVAALLAELAPRIRVDREVVWADGRGLDAARLAGRLVNRLTEVGVESRAGVAAVPVAAELAARWGPRPGREGEGPTPFLVKERTGWGWRRGLRPSSTGSPAVSGVPGARRSPAEEDGKPGRGKRGNGASDRGTSESGRSERGDRGADEAEAVRVVEVGVGEERAWLAALPLAALESDRRLLTLLEGVGVHTLGDLAGLEREAVEVRFGGEAVSSWRLARGDDRRMLFDRIPPERPHGSIEFVDYVLTDPSRLLFTANALLGPVCDRLQDRGEHARTLRLVLPLGNGETWERTIRPARPTASRDTWLRLVRGVLDRLTVPDAVTGMRVEVPTTEAAAVRQGDLFDRGFATASAVEAAVARLAERQLRPLGPEVNGHPVLERRAEWRTQSIARSAAAAPTAPARPTEGAEEATAVGLQLLSEPRRVELETAPRRDHEVPVRLRDRRGWREIVLAAGPDRISGGQWEAVAYAREYYRCVTEEGVPLWIYRDGLDGSWYLHGYWD